MNPNTRPIDDALVNLGLILVAGLAAFFAVLWAAAEMTGRLTGTAVHSDGLASGLEVLTRPLRPAGQQPIAYWFVTVLLVFTISAMAWCVWQLVGRTRHITARDPRRLAGIATNRDVRASVSRQALLKRAANLRPSLTAPGQVLSSGVRRVLLRRAQVRP